MQNLAQAYESGKSLRQLSRQTGLSIEGVRQKLLRANVKMRPIGKYERPRKPQADLKLPTCGVPPKLLYYQGNCADCEIALYGWKEERREKCGVCEK